MRRYLGERRTAKDANDNSPSGHDNTQKHLGQDGGHVIATDPKNWPRSWQRRFVELMIERAWKRL